jgi:hypothetical protein
LPIDEASIQRQRENESDWCQALVNGVLLVVLPPEDLSNPCLDVLVSEVFSDLILRNAVLRRVAEPWLLWEGITKISYSLRPMSTLPLNTLESTPQSRLDHFGLLSHADFAQEQNLETRQHQRLSKTSSVFWTALDYVALLWTLLRAFVIALTHASSLPSRAMTGQQNPALDTMKAVAVDPDEHAVRQPKPPALVQMQVWNCLGRIISLPQRMPWMSGFLSLLQWLSLNAFGGFASTNSAFDR